VSADQFPYAPLPRLVLSRRLLVAQIQIASFYGPGPGPINFQLLVAPLKALSTILKDRLTRRNFGFKLLGLVLYASEFEN
jgi:hypothetical protein